MALPQINTLTNSRALLRAFGGLNETYGCSEAEYSTGINWTTQDYPALSTRAPRRKVKALERVNGMYWLNGLLTVAGTTLYYEPDAEDADELVLENAVTDDEKQLVGMGTRILIFPDKKQLDIADGTWTDLGAQWSCEADLSEYDPLRFVPCDMEGMTYQINDKGTELPESAEDGLVYLQLNNEDKPWAGVNVLQQYNAVSGTWATITLDCCRIESTGIGTRFNVWDTIHISNVPDTAAEYLSADLEGDLVIYDKGEDWLLVHITPNTDSAYFYGRVVRDAFGTSWNSMDGGTEYIERKEMKNTTLERQVPDLEFVTECANRVWGCNSKENVIYACKLGDPTNWYSYRGIASDSYAVTVGSDGAFTGAASCMSYVLFFKENTLHKIYGTKPSDFQMSTLRCRGVAKDAAKSLCVINEALYYLSYEGVMTWEGSLPAKLSRALRAESLTNASHAVGGTLDGRYYLYLTWADTDEDGSTKSRLLVYDTERAIWHEESAVGLVMASTGRKLYLWDGAWLWAVETDGTAVTGEKEEQVCFEWVSGDIGMGDTADSYLGRITMWLDAHENSKVYVEASYDGGEWVQLGETDVTEEYTRLELALVPRRHDTMRLRIRGNGQVTLRSLLLMQAQSHGETAQGAKHGWQA